MTQRFDHAFAFGFALESCDDTGEHVSAAELRAAILRHLAALSDAELVENSGLLFDTFAVPAARGGAA